MLLEAHSPNPPMVHACVRAGSHAGVSANWIVGGAQGKQLTGQARAAGAIFSEHNGHIVFHRWGELVFAFDQTRTKSKEGGVIVDLLNE